MQPLICLIATYAVAMAATTAEAAPRPNILLVLADDLGYGDLQCLNPAGKISTPHLDRLAREGIAFTDAHSSSSVCTPTRYGVLTGRYNWRSRLQSFVLGGLSPRLIEPDRLTLAQLLRDHGYHTACLGKWHLGMDWKILPGREVSELSIETPEQVHNVDYSHPIANGPNSLGFDYYFGISASLDMVPYTYIENDRVTVLPTVDKDFPLFLGREQGRCRFGPAAPEFVVEEVLPELTRRAIAYLRARGAEAKAGRPFFLYLPLASPHTPVVPSEPWQGRSGLNYYADFVMQTDDSVGEILAELEAQGLAKNTLVIFTSDNGCSPQADFPALLAKGHHPCGVFRGHKADIFEGGHRVPLLVRWPLQVPPGRRSEQLVCLTDMLATVADALGATLPENAGEDSFSFLPALLGTDKPPARQAIVHHSINGSFAIRQGPWKLALCPDSGGWSEPRPGSAASSALPPTQLYDLTSDIGETTNVATDHPEIVERLTKLLQRYVEQGRSTPGPSQSNTVAPQIRKGS